MTDTITWVLIGEIQPSAEWLSTAPTDANAFRFEHINPPRQVRLHIAQTDGIDWLFEPRILSSERVTQILLMDNVAIFAGSRRLSLRYADLGTVVNNWTVRVYAATITINSSLVALIEAIQTQLETLTAAQATGLTAIQSKLDAIATALNVDSGGSSNGGTVTNSALGVAYTVSQSSNYGGHVATYANLTDGDGTTGTLTWEGHGWIQASFASPVTVAAVEIGAGNVTNVGYVSQNLNGSILQYSTDQQTWHDVWTIAGVADSGANQFVTHQLSPAIEAQFWRIYNASTDFGISELKFS